MTIHKAGKRPGRDRSEKPRVTMADGTVHEIEWNEAKAEVMLATLAWRHDPDNAATYLYAVSLHLLFKFKMPNDMQDKLLDAFSDSFKTRGKMTIDDALGLTRPRAGKGGNAYTSNQTKGKEADCLLNMHRLIKIYGIGKTMASELVVNRDKPTFNAGTLQRYYRESSDQNNMQWAVAVITHSSDTKLKYLQSFLPTCSTPKAKKKLTELIRDMELEAPLR